MARKKSKDIPLQGEVKMEDMPSEGQKVYYVDHRGTSGVLVATVNSIDHDNSTADLIVQDLNASGGCFTVTASAHDESMSPGTWHYPK
jgi:hypothetical protein